MGTVKSRPAYFPVKPVVQAAYLLQEKLPLLSYSLPFRWLCLLFVTPTKPPVHMGCESVWMVFCSLLPTISYLCTPEFLQQTTSLIRTPEFCQPNSWMIGQEGCFRIKPTTLWATRLTILPPACFENPQKLMSVIKHLWAAQAGTVAHFVGGAGRS